MEPEFSTSARVDGEGTAGGGRVRGIFCDGVPKIPKGGAAEMRKRPLRLEEYGISKYRFRELESFVRQHGEKIAGLQKIQEKWAWRKNMRPERRELLRAAQYRQDIRMVEEAARQAGGVMAGELLRNVMEEVPWERLDVPCGRETFYRIRRQFYRILDERKRGA